MHYSVSLDWLTVSLQYSQIGFKRAPELSSDIILYKRKLRQSLLYMSNFALKSEDIACDSEKTISRFYIANWHMENGFSMSLGTRLVQGCKATMSGRFLQSSPLKSRAIYNAFSENKVKKTRVDFAYDFFDSGFTTSRLWRNYIEPVFAGKKLKVSFVQSANGDTIYIGSRQSNFMVRIYDKGKEQKTDQDWIRFEIEIKKDGISCLTGDFGRDYRLGASKLMAMCRNLPVDISNAFKDISNGEAMEAVSKPRVKSKRELYLHTFVAKFVENTIDEEPAAVQQFLLSMHKIWVEKTGESLF